MPLITLSYLWLNASYLLILPLATVDGAQTLAVDFAEAVAGSVSGTIVTCGVALSAFGALNGSLFGAARLVHACGVDGTLPSVFGIELAVLGKKTPLVATLLQAAVASTLVLAVGDFATIVRIYIFAQWLFYLATMVALLWLRQTEPQLERPFRVWSWVPVVFVASATFVCGVLIWQSTWECAVSIGVLAIGLLVKLSMDRWEARAERLNERSPLIADGQAQMKDP